MQLSYRSSVNRWECDENDHLNVRFYVEKHWETLVAGMRSAGLDNAAMERLSDSLQVQHLRYLAEARIATPLSGYFGIVECGEGTVVVVTEICHSFSNEVLASCVHKLGDRGLATLINDSISKGVTALSKLGEHSGPRGITDDDLGFSRLRMADLSEHGFRQIGAGLVQPNECGADGKLLVHYYMGRLSDSMPHLWGWLQAGVGKTGGDLGSEPDGSAEEGGAVLEYRIRYHGQLTRYTNFSIHSGIASVGRKIQHFAHLIFDERTGQLLVSAEAVGVRMDLRLRKSITLSDDVMTEMQKQVLAPPF